MDASQYNPIHFTIIGFTIPIIQVTVLPVSHMLISSYTAVYDLLVPY